jgi:hypothetical protein
MTSFLIGLSPLLFVMGLLLLAARRDQRESAEIARQIQLTDALAEAVGVIVAPIAKRRFRKWQIVIRMPLGRPAVVARIVGVVHRNLERRGSDRYEIVLVPQEPPPAAALQRRSPGHRQGTDRGPASGPPAHLLEERCPQAIDEGRAQGDRPVDEAPEFLPGHRLHVEPARCASTRNAGSRSAAWNAERKTRRRSAGTPGGSTKGRASAAWSCSAISISRRASSLRASSTARATLASPGRGRELNWRTTTTAPRGHVARWSASTSSRSTPRQARRFPPRDGSRRFPGSQLSPGTGRPAASFDRRAEMITAAPSDEDSRVVPLRPPPSEGTAAVPPTRPARPAS